ncbi:4806_t:CDS:2, partial [Cetraspora pellucida]
MQKNEELLTELVDLYEVSFISQILKNLLAKEMLKDNDFDSDRENNAGSEKKAKVITQLPVPPDFNNLEH